LVGYWGESVKEICKRKNILKDVKKTINSKIKIKSKGSICYKLYFIKQSVVKNFPYTFLCESIMVSSPIEKKYIKQRSPDFSCN